VASSKMASLTREVLRSAARRKAVLPWIWRTSSAKRKDLPFTHRSPTRCELRRRATIRRPDEYSAEAWKSSLSCSRTVWPLSGRRRPLCAGLRPPVQTVWRLFPHAAFAKIQDFRDANERINSNQFNEIDSIASAGAAPNPHCASLRHYLQRCARSDRRSIDRDD